MTRKKRGVIKKNNKIIIMLLLAIIAFMGVGEVEAAAKINVKSKTIYVGKKTRLKVRGSKRKPTWKSKNKKIAVVSKTGVVTAKKAGKTTITAKIGKKTYKCKMTVKNPHINKSSVTIEKGKSYKLAVTGATKKAKWKSGNTKVATVNKTTGVVTGKSKGTVTMIGKIGTKKYTSKVTVTENQYTRTENQYTLTFDANGGTVSIKSKDITFDKTYGTLPIPQRNDYTFSGWYTAKTGGTKVTENTKTTVRKNVIVYAQWKKMPDEINPKLSVSVDKKWIVVGEQVQLNVEWNGPGEIRYKSFSPGTATVSETGVVTALKLGTVTINVEVINSGKYYNPQDNIVFYVAGGDKQEYTYEVYLLNSYKIYASSANANALLYIKTDNPDPSRIALIGGGSKITAGTFKDIKYTGKSYQTFTPVDGGYVVFAQPSFVGEHTVTVWEAYAGCSADDIILYYRYDDQSKHFGIKTDASVTFNAFDRNVADEEWIEDIIAKNTNSLMTFHEKMKSIEIYLRDNNRYPANSSGYVEEARLLKLVSQYGAPWDVGILDSESSPHLLMDIALRLGCTDMERLTGDYHAYVLFTYDNETRWYCACPIPELNAFDPDKLEFFDFSKF